jgi:hypothetical protein
VSLRPEDRPPAATDDTRFDYTTLDADTEAYVRSRTATIRARGQRLCGDLVGMGNDLRAVKDSLPHGQFHNWLELEFGWSERTARNYMALADAFGHLNPATLAGSEITALQLLASSSTPEDVRDDFITQAERGESITVRDVRGALSDAVPSRRSDPLDRWFTQTYNLDRPPSTRDVRRDIQAYDESERPHVVRLYVALGKALLEAATPYLERR